LQFNLCICEDDGISANILAIILETYFEDRHLSYEVSIYNKGATLLDDFKEGYVNLDILIMDIYLEHENGIDICKKLRKQGYSGTIVFMTSSKEHAIEGYDVDARAYLLKPYDPDEIHRTFDRLLSNVSMSMYTIKIYSQIIRIPIYEIMYVESSNTKCVIHCDGDIDYTVYKKLSEIEAELNDSHFLRCHQSYLVNMAHIVEANECFILSNGANVPIRKRDAKQFKDMYIEYIKKYN
jgi:DNA-binding LytR/AlgR family response regulator